MANTFRRKKGRARMGSLRKTALVAVVLYPAVKRQNEGVALGFVGARTLEAATIFVGIASLLSVVTLRQAGVGEEALVIGRALVAVYDRTFLLGQGLIPAVNALLLGSLLYRSRLVPQVLPLLGLVGAPLPVAAHSPRCSASWTGCPRCRQSLHSRWRCGSLRWAYG